MSYFCRESPTPVFTSLPALPFIAPPQALVPSTARGNMADVKRLPLQILYPTWKALHLPKQKFGFLLLT